MSEEESDMHDRASAHRRPSAECFIETWEYIEKETRTPEEEEEMLRLTMASHWHWTHRDDYQPRNASVAYWQISRVFALMGQVDNVRRFGLRSVASVENEDIDPFCLGYGYEALARAEAVAGNRTEMEVHLAKAKEIAASVENEENRKLLVDDLKTIQIQ